jgi:alditol oxidase
VSRNWGGNLAYSTSRVLRPESVEEAQELVAAADALRPLGTRHSFNTIADSTFALLSTERLTRVVELAERTVTVEAGIRYGDLSAVLHEHGRALPNLASLPHISIGGAVATGTHGSGVRNPSLAANVAALDVVRADGELVRLHRGDADFDGAVVSLGALGVVARLTLDVVPAFEVRQYVYDDLPWEADLDALFAAGYSVSLITRLTAPAVAQVWVKTTTERDPAAPFLGAKAATSARHPIVGAPTENATEQLGVAGPSHERLPHFRLGFTPSAGEEIQSEYMVARRHAPEVLHELRRLGPELEPPLLVSEIRTVAADDLWLSPFFERDSVALHFTWALRPREVLAALPLVEAVLAQLDARPHWGKLFTIDPAPLYPRLRSFRALVERYDPQRKFANAFLEAVLRQRR